MKELTKEEAFNYLATFIGNANGFKGAEIITAAESLNVLGVAANVEIEAKGNTKPPVKRPPESAE